VAINEFIKLVKFVKFIKSLGLGLRDFMYKKRGAGFIRLLG